MPMLSKNQVSKMNYIGSRQARRVLPGQAISFEMYPNITIKEVVNAVYLYKKNKAIIVTEQGTRIKVEWNEYVSVYELEGAI